MHHKWLYIVLLIGVAAGALAFRLPRLDVRPMHGDEANQAVKAGRLHDTGEYRYDPEDHHGPTLYYLTLPFFPLTGAEDLPSSTEWTFRLVPVVFGAATILLLGLLRSGLGPAATLFAAVFTAISPAFVFYSRYYIQESLLVCFTLLTVAAGWRYALRPHWAWALTAGAGLGLMYSTKETAVLAWAAMAGGVMLTAVWQGGLRRAALMAPVRAVSPAHGAAALLAAIAVSALLFSSFLANPRGMLDSVLAYFGYLDKAGRPELHVHPWHYYLGLLAYTKREAGPWWSEGLVLGLAAVGGAVTAARGLFAQSSTKTPLEPSGQHAHHVAPHALAAFVMLYTLLLTAIYSVIPYKTPWSMLSFYHAMVLMAGIGAAGLIRTTPTLVLKGALVLLLAAGSVHLGRQAWMTNFRYAADHRNPYVYAHTSTALVRLANQVDDLAAVHPDGHAMRIDVIKPDADYWPLPWYLRAYGRVGYWTAIPPRLEAPVIISGVEVSSLLSEHFDESWHTQFSSLRPGVLLHMHVRKDLWDAFLATRSQ